ncbi:beta-galactosidase [Paenibacillus xylanilyticus]|uniref:Beta-galactosidase n=1 Tax=Paenibacillus xylanilyticus TaxID=248903 RepID=A0A7Y6BUZ4_9BACL|nr:beta-galactosidase [Paenibacillus xylanilyticus]NUU74926.1 beta-galactosidase [Paenibacillus xylanilyticus]
MFQVSKLSLKNVGDKEIYPGKLGENGGANPQGESFGFTNYYMTRNGEPFIPVVGEFHFSRFSYLHWEEELLKMKAGGIHIVATYVFWNFHEEEEGIFVWGGRRNLRHFIDLCAKLDFPLILRIGPFCHGEVRNGGIPDWVLSKPIEIRSNDPDYLKLARKLYREIAVQMKGSLYQDGGPVIAVQLENEFMHAGAPNDAWGYKTGKFLSSGTGGTAHLAELRRIAEDAGIRPLFFTATAWGGAAVPEEGFLPMLAGYAYTSWIPAQPPSTEFLYRDLHDTPAEPVHFDVPEYPVAYCEMAGGMQVSYNVRPYVPENSIEAMTLVKLASGSNLLGYYMYHGGSNPVGKKGYLNEQFLPKITYDYQSPLGEFGRVGASYDRIRAISIFLQSFGSILAPMKTILPEGQSTIDPTDTETLRWCVRHHNGSGFVFLNNFQDQVNLTSRKIRIELETVKGHVAFPAEGELELPGGIGLMLPFNLELHGVSLVSATTPLLTEIETDNEKTIFFYAHEGMAPEYVVSKTNLTDVHAGEGILTDRGSYYVIQPSVNKLDSVHFRTTDGRNVRFVTLSREEAQKAYTFELWGQKTLVISDCPVIFNQHQLVCTSMGVSRFDVSLYPAPAHDLQTKNANSIPCQKEESTFFATYTLELPEYTPDVLVTKPAEKSALLQFAGEWPSHVHDVWLEVDYEGDVAEAFLNGRLITDHVYYGKTWSIGLKEFYTQLESSTLHLSITPQRRGTVHTFVNQAQIERFEGVEIAEFHRIEAIPQYQVALYPVKTSAAVEHSPVPLS